MIANYLCLSIADYINRKLDSSAPTAQGEQFTWTQVEGQTCRLIKSIDQLIDKAKLQIEETEKRHQEYGVNAEW